MLTTNKKPNNTRDESQYCKKIKDWTIKYIWISLLSQLLEYTNNKSLTKQNTYIKFINNYCDIFFESNWSYREKFLQFKILHIRITTFLYEAIWAYNILIYQLKLLVLPSIWERVLALESKDLQVPSNELHAP